MKNKIFYNFVINEHLWFTILEYLKNCKHVYDYDDSKLKSVGDSTLDEIKEYANKAIIYLEEEEFPDIYKLDKDDGAPVEWYVLYYMTLAYLYDVPSNYYHKRLYECSLSELKKYCKETIAWLKKLSEEIRETSDEDL